MLATILCKVKADNRAGYIPAGSTVACERHPEMPGVFNVCYQGMTAGVIPTQSLMRKTWRVTAMEIRRDGVIQLRKVIASNLTYNEACGVRRDLPSEEFKNIIVEPE